MWLKQTPSNHIMDSRGIFKGRTTYPLTWHASHPDGKFSERKLLTSCLCSGTVIIQLKLSFMAHNRTRSKKHLQQHIWKFIRSSLLQKNNHYLGGQLNLLHSIIFIWFGLSCFQQSRTLFLLYICRFPPDSEIVPYYDQPRKEE